MFVWEKNMILHKIKSIRTNNFNDPEMFSKVTDLWSKSVVNIPENKIRYGIYHNYQSDYRGDYSLTTAIEDKNDMSGILIPDSNKYITYTDDSNDVPKLWKQVWLDEDNKKIIRKYDYDFEKYYPDGTVEVYISVK